MTQLVVGAIIVDSPTHPTRVLAARRSKPADLRGKWEFPGGKVEPDETPQQALVRELQEELSIRIDVGDELRVPEEVAPATVSKGWPINETLELHLYFAEITAGEPTPGEDHDDVRWLETAELHTVDWLPTDAAALPALRTAIG